MQYIHAVNCQTPLPPRFMNCLSQCDLGREIKRLTVNGGEWV
uniref:Uncharacterized protein n=1 Tax=Anguilla anguilla TaxID=7936 RepID=A0A0E9X7B5_ANGAN